MTIASTLIAYQYDALDRLIGMTLPDEPPLNRFFLDGAVVTQVQGERRDCFLREQGRVIAHSSSQGGTFESTLLGTDQSASILQSLGPERRTDFAYTPYGDQAPGSGLKSLLGFNAELADPVTGCYLLGAGYRAYNPVLMRFHSPDSLSPFGSGGINPYAYCIGDPINRSDPTGHFSWLTILGIAIAVVSIAVTVVTLGVSAPVTGPAATGGISLSTAAAVIDIAGNAIGIAATVAQEVAPQSKAGSILGYASLGLGVAAFGTRQLANSALGAKLGAKTAGSALQRQGAVRSAKNAGKSFAQSTGAGARNTVVITERLQKAEQLLNYNDYSLTGYETLTDYVIPYLSSGQEQQADPAQEAETRQREQQGLLAAANDDAMSFTSSALSRMEEIRQPN